MRPEPCSVPAPPRFGWLVALVVLAATACAPVYYPSALHVPMLSREADGHLNGGVGFHGLQANAAYGVTDRIAARGTVHLTELDGGPDPHYRLVSLGVGLYDGATRDTDVGSGVRLAVWFDAGFGTAAGEAQVGSTETFRRNSGQFVRVAAQVDLAFETPIAAIGLAVRPVWFHFEHDDSSTADEATADWLFIEPALVARLGPPQIHFEPQIGVLIPAGGRGDIGLPVPWIFSLGVGSRF